MKSGITHTDGGRRSQTEHFQRPEETKIVIEWERIG